MEFELSLHQIEISSEDCIEESEFDEAKTEHCK